MFQAGLAILCAVFVVGYLLFSAGTEYEDAQSIETCEAAAVQASHVDAA